MYIVVTGGSKGIGKAVVSAFANEGATVSFCARNEQHLYQTLATLQMAYPQAKLHAMVADLTDKRDLENFAIFCYKFGTPDVVVNNAGAFIPGRIVNESDGLLEEMIKLNLYSAYNFTRKILPAMITQKAGHIFNMCSIASLKAYPNGGSYGISKYALMGFSQNLREELKQHNIKVTTVYPGAVMTDSWGDFDNTQNRIMEAEDIAYMILAASKLSISACVEDIVIRPQLGDL